MRSLLQFIGAASSALCITLLAGTLLTGVARADGEPAPFDGAFNFCDNCCGCSAAAQTCVYTGGGRQCQQGPCNCNCTHPNPNNYLCKNA